MGGEVGRDWLRVLSSASEAMTGLLLDREDCGGGALPGRRSWRWRCHPDAGLRLPAGRAVGVDRDALKVASAAADLPVNVDLRVEDLAQTVRTGYRYDVVDAWFVLSHLADAARWVDALAQLVDLVAPSSSKTCASRGRSVPPLAGLRPIEGDLLRDRAREWR